MCAHRKESRVYSLQLHNHDTILAPVSVCDFEKPYDPENYSIIRVLPAIRMAELLLPAHAGYKPGSG